mmetsp:Transcript_24101/g.69553  ORF Transcript_24101/g.69553 Transcript_24101/m.69553 type:complete len:319 (+) Transcript_24101:142-1098(+)
MDGSIHPSIHSISSSPTHVCVCLCLLVIHCVSRPAIAHVRHTHTAGQRCIHPQTVSQSASPSCHPSPLGASTVPRPRRRPRPGHRPLAPRPISPHLLLTVNFIPAPPSLPTRTLRAVTDSPSFEQRAAAAAARLLTWLRRWPVVSPVAFSPVLMVSAWWFLTRLPPLTTVVPPWSVTHGPAIVQSRSTVVSVSVSVSAAVGVPGVGGSLSGGARTLRHVHLHSPAAFHLAIGPGLSPDVLAVHACRALGGQRRVESDEGDAACSGGAVGWLVTGGREAHLRDVSAFLEEGRDLVLGGREGQIAHKDGGLLFGLVLDGC